MGAQMESGNYGGGMARCWVTGALAEINTMYRLDVGVATRLRHELAQRLALLDQVLEGLAPRAGATARAKELGLGQNAVRLVTANVAAGHTRGLMCAELFISFGAQLRGQLEDEVAELCRDPRWRDRQQRVSREEMLKVVELTASVYRQLLLPGQRSVLPRPVVTDWVWRSNARGWMALTRWVCNQWPEHLTADAGGGRAVEEAVAELQAKANAWLLGREQRTP